MENFFIDNILNNSLFGDDDKNKIAKESIIKFLSYDEEFIFNYIFNQIIICPQGNENLGKIGFSFVDIRPKDVTFITNSNIKIDIKCWKAIQMIDWISKMDCIETKSGYKKGSVLCYRIQDTKKSIIFHIISTIDPNLLNKESFDKVIILFKEILQIYLQKITNARSNQYLYSIVKNEKYLTGTPIPLILCFFKSNRILKKEFMEKWELIKLKTIYDKDIDEYLADWKSASLINDEEEYLIIKEEIFEISKKKFQILQKKIIDDYGR